MKRVFVAVLGLAATALASKPARPLEPNLFFEPNRGQAPRQVRFLSRGVGGMACLMDGEAVLRTGNSAVRMRLMGTAPSTGEALDLQPGVSSYFATQTASGWHTGIPHYNRVRYRGVYPGIDLVYYGAGGRMEYDFVVAPGADPSRIRVRYEGLRSIAVSAEGDLLLATDGGVIRQHRPVVYQQVAGGRREVAASYQIVNQREVRFLVGQYRHGLPLVIDPVLEYGSYFGGVYQDTAEGMAVDGRGDVYVAGAFTLPGETFDPSGAFTDSPFVGGVTLMKFSTANNTVLYEVHLSSGFYERATAVAVDADGNAYLTGTTTSANFPLANPLQSAPRRPNDRATGFVTKISADGSKLLYSTYLGGSNGDVPSSIAVDVTGAAYVGGGTQSQDFPLVKPVQSAFGKPVLLPGNTTEESEMVFLSKLSPAGDALVYSTLYGGSGWNQLARVVVDSSGSPYLVGFTTASDFPLVHPLQSSFATFAWPRFNQAAFAVKLAADGQSVAYATYLGGNSLTGASSGAVDSAGNLYIAGSTLATDFPVVNALQPKLLSTRGNGFLSKLNPTGSALLYSTYLGGSKVDDIGDIAVDAAGYVYGAGTSASPDFPVKDSLAPLAGTNSGDAVVFKLAPSGTSFVWSTFIGGTASDQARAIAVSAGAVYVMGSTFSDDFPTRNPYQASKAGLGDVFLVKFAAPAPPVTVLPNAVELTAGAGTGAASQLVSVTFNGGPPCGQCKFEASTLDGGKWLDGTFVGADASGQFSIVVDASSLAPGTYTGTVRLTPPEGGDSADVLVSFRVVPQ